MSANETTLAARLGCTVHVSPLRMKLCRLFQATCRNADVLEDWLIDIANARGARIVTRGNESILPPDESSLSNEELVAGILLPQNLDRPQMLRLAAQLISREAVRFRELRRLAVRERIERVLAELADRRCGSPLTIAYGGSLTTRLPSRNHFARLCCTIRVWPSRFPSGDG